MREGEISSEITTFGPYILKRRLATGGTAELFLAEPIDRNSALGSPLVVKRLLADLATQRDFATMFLDEARISIQFDHPNIINVLDYGSADDKVYIVMEYISGTDLARLGRQINWRFPPEIACFAVAELCKALEYAHMMTDNRGRPLEIVHRDVNPPNVLIALDGRVILTDFGIAKARERYTVTRTGVLKGKMAYMAPEQVAGAQVDNRTDLFATGIILYQLLTGQRPFSGKTPIDLARAIRRAHTKPPSVLRSGLEGLDRIVMTALAREPSERYQTASQFEADLREWINIRATITQHDLASFVENTIYGPPKEQDAPSIDPSSSVQLAQTGTQAVIPGEIPGARETQEAASSSHRETRATGDTRRSPSAADESSRSETAPIPDTDVGGNRDSSQTQTRVRGDDPTTAAGSRPPQPQRPRATPRPSPSRASYEPVGATENDPTIPVASSAPKKTDELSGGAVPKKKPSEIGTVVGPRPTGRPQPRPFVVEEQTDFMKDPAFPALKQRRQRLALLIVGCVAALALGLLIVPLVHVLRKPEVEIARVTPTPRPTAPRLTPTSADPTPIATTTERIKTISLGSPTATHTARVLVTPVAHTPTPVPTRTVARTPAPRPTARVTWVPRRTPQPVHTPHVVHSTPTPTPRPTPAPPKRGSLSINMNGWYSVAIDGRPVPRGARLKGIPLPAGEHTVAFQDQAGRARTEVDVDIYPGRDTKLRPDPP